MQRFQDYYGGYGEETVDTTDNTTTTEPEPTTTEEEESTTYGPIHILSPLPPLFTLIAGYINYDDHNANFDTTYSDYKTTTYMELVSGSVGLVI